MNDNDDDDNIGDSPYTEKCFVLPAVAKREKTSEETDICYPRLLVVAR